MTHLSSQVHFADYLYEDAQFSFACTAPSLCLHIPQLLSSNESDSCHRYSKSGPSPLRGRCPTIRPTMSSLTATYVLPALLLNPVFILHTVNTIVSRIPHTLPASAIATAPLPPLGPHATLPYFDMHANDSLCWSYTAVMVGAQLLAFGRVSGVREAGRRKRADQLQRQEDLRKALELEMETETETETEEEMA